MGKKHVHTFRPYYTNKTYKHSLEHVSSEEHIIHHEGFLQELPNNSCVRNLHNIQTAYPQSSVAIVLTLLHHENACRRDSVQHHFTSS